MSTQVPLFHDSIYDALTTDALAIGGVKKAAGLLWPNMADPASRLRACLSIEHSQKLDAEELLSLKRLARTAGSMATIDYEAQQLGFKVTWISPEDEHAALQRAYIDAVKEQKRILERMERLQR